MGHGGAKGDLRAALRARVSFEALRERALVYFAPVARFPGLDWRCLDGVVVECLLSPA
jgi:hypothetical protein